MVIIIDNNVCFTLSVCACDSLIVIVVIYYYLCLFKVHTLLIYVCVFLGLMGRNGSVLAVEERILNNLLCVVCLLLIGLSLFL